MTVVPRTRPRLPDRRRVFEGLVAKGASLRVDQPSAANRALAERLVAGSTTPRARALACFRFVRDEVVFGFTPQFDLASAFGRGHCNPQAGALREPASCGWRRAAPPRGDDL